MRRLLALKWRLLPLLAAAIIISFPFIESAITRHHVAGVARAAQKQLDSKPVPTKISGSPVRIIIPSLAIDLPVDTQHYSRALKSWPVSPADANYAAETPPLNNYQGQTLIYGHDNRAVFGFLLSMPLGTEVYVYTDKHIFKYTYSGYKDVSPVQTDIVSKMKKGPAGLNLITCTGAYFQYRHLMSLKLIQAT